MSSQLLPDSTSRALTVTYSLCSLTAEGSFAAFPRRLRDELQGPSNVVSACCTSASGKAVSNLENKKSLLSEGTATLATAASLVSKLAEQKNVTLHTFFISEHSELLSGALPLFIS